MKNINKMPIGYRALLAAAAMMDAGANAITRRKKYAGQDKPAAEAAIAKAQAKRERKAKAFARQMLKVKIGQACAESILAIRHLKRECSKPRKVELTLYPTGEREPA